MSVQTQPHHELSEKAQKLLSYFETELEKEGGEMYTKSKFIADEVNLSSKEIGTLILQLQDADTNITIEKWSYTAATTWLVTRTN